MTVTSAHRGEEWTHFRPLTLLLLMLKYCCNIFSEVQIGIGTLASFNHYIYIYISIKIVHCNTNTM